MPRYFASVTSTTPTIFTCLVNDLRLKYHPLETDLPLRDRIDACP